MTDLADLAEPLRDEALEGLDENNIHRFHHELVLRFSRAQLSPHQLLEYDQNIVKHTQKLNEGRTIRQERPIVWKYFQYLALLFTEIYLDRYFTDDTGLLLAINKQISLYNEDKQGADEVIAFDAAAPSSPQLSKLAYWSATGSGKTLLMHANVLQYRHYLEKHGRARELNRVILLTPNEGLSRQHLMEFAMSGIEAELFDKDGRGLFAGHSVEIIDIHKLGDEMGKKTIAVEAFEGNNLVLVDEGHRGATGGIDGAWMRFRDALCEQGFSFEYSATFGQAIRKSPNLTQLYARSILLDYSYRYFYSDGFGKDYEILNLDKDTQESQLELYLAACLLTFFQQQRLYSKEASAFQPFNIQKPLWMFVGSKVTALAAKDASDIIEILRFLASYVSSPSESVRRIERVLNQGLQTASGKNVFAGRFAYLNTAGLTAQALFDETLSTLFNAPGGGSLYVENLRGAPGEIALRIGDNDPFGVINVGDDSKLCRLCESYMEMVVTEREFSDSLFDQINRRESTLNILIGSKKFSEGWNSWRVSTMGLMNIGASEGSQIIQLFGRGVRLQGYDWSLKRSARTVLPQGLRQPKHISMLETLAIFGIHADYMAQFRDFLKEEGMRTSDNPVEVLLPVIRNLGKVPLKSIRLQKTIGGTSAESNDAFRQLGPVPSLVKPDPTADASTLYLVRNQVVVNWYPKIRAMRSSAVADEGESARNEAHLTANHVAFLDIDRLYLEVQRFKSERGWYNLNISRGSIEELLGDQSWYRLQIPAEELAFDSFDRVRVWEEIALSLLEKYVDRYYKFRKMDWELPHLEYRDLGLDDPNFVGVRDGSADTYYRITLDESQEEIAVKLGELKASIEAGKMLPWEFQGLEAVWFSQHLYRPLLYADNKSVEISPVPLNLGEARFIEDLQKFYENDGGFFKGKELYLLRNLSRGRGLGFFEAGNFHPDFILWLVSGGEQRVLFVDPKGIRNLGANDPKIRFHETIKEVEARLGEPQVSLESYIISNTPSSAMQQLWNVDKNQMTSWNILFQEEDKSTYVRAMLSAAP